METFSTFSAFSSFLVLSSQKFSLTLSLGPIFHRDARGKTERAFDVQSFCVSDSNTATVGIPSGTIPGSGASP